MLEAFNYIKEPANLSDYHMNFIEASILYFLENYSLDFHT